MQRFNSVRKPFWRGPVVVDRRARATSSGCVRMTDTTPAVAPAMARTGAGRSAPGDGASSVRSSSYVAN